MTTQIAGIDALTHDPYNVLSNAEEGAVAIFIANAPVFYAVTSERLAQLLETDVRAARQESWRPLPLTSRQKVRFFIMFSGSRSSRSGQIGRARRSGQLKRDISTFSELDKHLPQGFRGAK